jgi:hypothetical protein
MPFPPAWPPRVASGRHSIRFYATDAATAVFADAAYMFADGAGANPFTPLPVVNPAVPTVVPPTPYGGGTASGNSPLPQIWAQTIRVCNDSAGDLELSFDGVNVHGKLAGNTEVTYRNRFEAGIAVRAAGGNTFRIEAW